MERINTLSIQVLKRRIEDAAEYLLRKISIGKIGVDAQIEWQLEHCATKKITKHTSEEEARIAAGY